MVARKRVVVVIDHSSGTKHAMMWALNHVAGAGDTVTLLHVLHPPGAAASSTAAAARTSSLLADSLAALCKASKPEVEVEALVVHGPKLPTVLSQIKKLEASVVVLSQNKTSPFCCFFPGGAAAGEDFVERCIDEADCLAMAVRKRGGGVGGYLVSTRWQKNFWLLA
ncbi:unnamed protein product [Spirodela intermedia]|uniref:UspA domain-containing protein n=1 Tax=Spirodela intermedia TaxID=51605 RepID=A0A7I8KR79_SPIIN|nr:unnamed protein product [Spirodela intermedia]